MILWHGSPCVVKRPRLELCRPHNDYGPGFYCTEYEELAREWACPGDEDGFANRYELKIEGLRVLDLSDSGYSVLTWLTLLLAHRIVDLSNAVAKEARSYLLDHFLVDIAAYDLIRGYRADDSYFSFARAFLNNTISVNQLSQAMRLGELGEQVVLKSPKAFQALRFQRADSVSCDIYGQKRMERDARARGQYQTLAARFDRDGLYVRDIIREEVGPHGECLFC